MEKKWYEVLHHIVDFLIPVCLILLIGILVIEFFFVTIAEHYHIAILLADSFIVFVFFLDVVFKYQRASSIPNFLKESWLDIIAIFPFFLFFRVFEGIGIVKAAGEVAELSTTSQKFLHTGVGLTNELSALELGAKEIGTIEKEAKVAKEVEVILKEGARSERLAQFAKPVLTTPRLAEAATFYEKPGKMEIRKKVPKPIKIKKVKNRKPKSSKKNKSSKKK